MGEIPYGGRSGVARAGPGMARHPREEHRKVWKVVPEGSPFPSTDFPHSPAMDRRREGPLTVSQKNRLPMDTKRM